MAEVDSDADWLPNWRAPSAWREHAPFAAWLVAAAKPQLIVELGTHWGFSYFAFCQRAAELGLSTRLVAIDTWQGDSHAGQYGDEVYAAVAAHNKQYGERSTLMRMTFDSALEHVEDASVDLLHIDGFHTYSAVRRDFETWTSKLSRRGVVIFHDTAVVGRGFGVARFFEEARAGREWFEFSHGFGLGVLCVGEEAPEPVRSLCAARRDPDATARVRGSFAAAGRTLNARLPIAMPPAEESVTDALPVEGPPIESVELSSRSGQTASPAASSQSLLIAAIRSIKRLARRSEVDVVRQSGLFDSEWVFRQAPALACSGDPLSDLLVDPEFASLDPCPLVSARHLKGKDAFGGHPVLAYANSDWRNGASPHPLVDPQHYWRGAPPEAETIAHWRTHGVSEGRSPHILFDAQYYARNAGLDGAPVDPLTHFLLVGSAAGLAPHPLIDSGFLRAHAPEGVEPLSWYASDGWRSGATPHPLFDPLWYAAQGEAPAGDPFVHFLKSGAAIGRSPSPYFDPAWYLDQLGCEAGSAQSNPLAHYLTEGWALRRSPHPLFDIDFYFDANPDVFDAAVEPLRHYVEHGWREGRLPHPLFEPTWLWETPEDPLRAYLSPGGATGRSPSPLFDLEWWRRWRVRPKHENPLLDYVLGSRSGDLVDACPLVDEAYCRVRYGGQMRSGEGGLSFYLRMSRRGGVQPHRLFDPEYYRRRYPDVDAEGGDPLVHYMRRGWREGRQPHPQFDPIAYLAEHPEVAEAGRNPLVDYLERYSGTGETSGGFPDAGASSPAPDTLLISAGQARRALTPLECRLDAEAKLSKTGRAAGEP